MIVKLELDPKLVWRLEELAEKGGQSLGQYIADLVTLRAPAPRLRPGSRAAEILRLHGEGLTDVEIAERLECVRAYVTQIRNRHGLKPNRGQRVGT